MGRDSSAAAAAADAAVTGIVGRSDDIESVKQRSSSESAMRGTEYLDLALTSATGPNPGRTSPTSESNRIQRVPPPSPDEVDSGVDETAGEVGGHPKVTVREGRLADRRVNLVAAATDGPVSLLNRCRRAGTWP